MLENIAYFFEILAALSATFFYKKYKDTKLKTFLFFIWYVVLNDILFSKLYILYIDPKNNTILYNIYRFVLFNYLFWLIYNHLTDSLRKKIIVGCAGLFTLGYLINVYLDGFQYGNFQYSTLLGCILYVIAALYYFIELLKKSDIDNIKNQAFVWICVGYLIYGIGFPVVFFARHIKLEGPNFSPEYFEYLQFILGMIVICIYSIIGLAFVWSKNMSAKDTLD
tara:strand:+ start:59168 stop:59836 length:669 start_codon:yes stop_codon:yes gene_type:complete